MDERLAKILSSFFLDIAKAYFIGTLVTSSFNNEPAAVDNSILIRGISSVILFLFLSWICAKNEDKK